MGSRAHVQLGRTDLQVSRLGLGLASLGGMHAAVPHDQAIATIDQAWESGIRLFDTAPVYGYGLSEQRAGIALGSRPRDEFVLCTKVGRLIVPGGTDTQDIWVDPPPGVAPRLAYSYGAIWQSVEASLERLGLDRVDALHIHDPEQDFRTATTDAFRALSELRLRGLIGAVSIGVNHADVAARFLREVPPPGPDCVLLAGRYTLLDQSAADDLLPLCRDLGVAVMAAGVFQGGVLADPSPDAPHGFTTITDALAARLDTLRGACESHDVPIKAAAFQFPLRDAAVPTVVVGARRPEEVAEVAGLMDHPIPLEFWDDLDRQGLVRT